MFMYAGAFLYMYIEHERSKFRTGCTVCDLLLPAVADSVCLKTSLENSHAHTLTHTVSHTVQMQNLYMQPAQGWEIALRHEKPCLKWLPHITPHN